MRNLLLMTRHELRMMFVSAATYAAAVLFLLLMALIYFFGLEDSTRFVRDYSPLEAFFRNFWWPVFFMVPMLTMRSLAEERRQGTLETLRTTPVSTAEIVLSKFLGSYCFYLLLWSLTLVFPLIVRTLSPQAAAEAGLLEPAVLLGGYGFIALSGTLYVAIGLFASSLTRSQLVAGMLAFTLLFIVLLGGKMLYYFRPLEEATLPGLSGTLDYLNTFRHLEDFSSGLFDTRPVFFYLSNCLLMLGLTALIIDRRAHG